MSYMESQNPRYRSELHRSSEGLSGKLGALYLKRLKFCKPEAIPSHLNWAQPYNIWLFISPTRPAYIGTFIVDT